MINRLIVCWFCVLAFTAYWSYFTIHARWKKSTLIKWTLLFATSILFVVYYFWFSNHSSTLFTVRNYQCNYTNGDYQATIEYYNPRTKEEYVFHSIIQVKNCSIFKINFREKNKNQESIPLPIEMEDDGRATEEDENEGIYNIKID